jgi:hypothetical protein
MELEGLLPCLQDLSFAIRPYLFRIRVVLSSLLRLGISNDLFPSFSPVKVFACISHCTMHAICPAHRNFLIFFKKITSGTFGLP